MSHEYIYHKIAGKIRGFWRNYHIIVLIILVGIGGFALGRLSLLDASKSAISIIDSESAAQKNEVVASSKGSKYHFPWCGGATRIKAENLIQFGSPTEARKSGYLPAQNCKGLK